MEFSQDGLHSNQHYQQEGQVLGQEDQQQKKSNNIDLVGSRRGLLKVSIEASPLQQIGAPPCNVRSIAVANAEGKDDCALVYLGTDSGDLYLFTWYRLLSSVAASSLPDSPDHQGKNTLLLAVNKNLGLTPVDCLCPIPRAGALAALLGKQVVVVDLLSLTVLEWLPSSTGAFALARAFGSLSSSVLLKGSTSHGIAADRDVPISPQTPKKSVGQGQLGRLFGSGRLSAKRAGERTNSNSNQSIKKESNSTFKEADIGTQGFANYRAASIERFAVSIKQKLILYTVSKGGHILKAAGSNGTAITVKKMEMAGPEEVVTMAWVDNVIITGSYQEYMLFSVMDGQATLLFSLPQDLISPPLLKVFPKELEVLLLMDAVGVAVNAAGHPTSSTLAFKDIPDAVGQSSAYVVVVKRGIAELYHRKTGAKVQSILLSDAAVGPNLIADDDDGKLLVVSSSSKVYCLERVPLDEQLKELLRQRQFDEAVGLAEECTNDMEGGRGKEKLAIVHAQAGFLLFFDLRFKDAVDHFLQSTTMHPAELFPFFPSMTERWRSMIPRVRYWGLHPPPQALQNVIENKLQSIQRGLVLQSVSDMKDLPNGHDGLMPTSTRSKSSIIQEYTKLAMGHVIRYLKASRVKPLASSVKEGVDTLLMKLLMHLGSTDEMECFAASENSCLVDEVEGLLQKNGQLRALAYLHETKGMVLQALQVWQALAEGSPHVRMGNTVSGTRTQGVNPMGKVEPSQQLAAAREASRLLEASSDGILVLRHLNWVLKVSQDLAIQVLTSSRREKPIPPDDVLLHLDLSEVYVKQRYLQWLVQDMEEENSHYHTLLAVSLARSALEELTNSVDHVKASEESLHIKRGHRERLQGFLESSDKYDAKAVLALIQGSEFWREQAILYRKLGDETQVFQILALKLEDIEAAERYCTELGRPDAYMRLLDMYLRPGEGREPMYGAAVHLLQLHGASLDPLQVLEALSPNMPFQLVYESIAHMMRTRTHWHREGQILRHLTRAENFGARLARLEQRARHMLVTDQSSCGSCRSRFGTKLFALYPNGSVVCYKCFRESGSTIDPVTGRDFEKDVQSTSITPC